jgi:hypothetical protein
VVPHLQAVQLLDSRQAAPVAAGLLYQLSIEDSAKPIFAFCSGALPRLYESIMRAMGAGASGPSSGAAGGLGLQDSSFAGFAGVLAAAGGAGGDLRSVPELIALAVNLAHSKRTAEVRAGCGRGGGAWGGVGVGGLRMRAPGTQQAQGRGEVSKHGCG